MVRRSLPLYGIMALWLCFLLGAAIVVLRQDSTRSLPPLRPFPVIQPRVPHHSAITSPPTPGAILAGGTGDPPHARAVVLAEIFVDAVLPDDPPSRGRLAVPATSARARSAGQPPHIDMRTVHAADSARIPGLVQARALATPTASPTAVEASAQVWVTGYSLQGITATGVPSGPGICAVDPSFIPFGAHITIVGFGSCVAADTGPAVVGAHIDVWVPSASEAYGLTGWYTVRWS